MNMPDFSSVLITAGASIATGITSWLASMRFYRSKSSVQEDQAIEIAQRVRNSLNSEIEQLYKAVVAEKDLGLKLQSRIDLQQLELARKDQQIAELKAQNQLYEEQIKNRDDEIEKMRQRITALEQKVNK